jgi:hypothetical protein
VRGFSFLFESGSEKIFQTHLRFIFAGGGGVCFLFFVVECRVEGGVFCDMSDLSFGGLKDLSLPAFSIQWGGEDDYGSQ